jgi:hypothetical protein
MYDLSYYPKVYTVLYLTKHNFFLFIFCLVLKVGKDGFNGQVLPVVRDLKKRPPGN